MVVCLERGADCLHMVQPGCRGKEAIERVYQLSILIMRFLSVCVLFFLYILVTSFIGQVDYIINVMYDCTRWHMCVLLLLVILDIFTNIEDIFSIRGKVLS